MSLLLLLLPQLLYQEAESVSEFAEPAVAAPRSYGLRLEPDAWPSRVSVAATLLVPSPRLTAKSRARARARGRLALPLAAPSDESARQRAEASLRVAPRLVARLGAAYRTGAVLDPPTPDFRVAATGKVEAVGQLAGVGAGLRATVAARASVGASLRVEPQWLAGAAPHARDVEAEDLALLGLHEEGIVWR